MLPHAPPCSKDDDFRGRAQLSAGLDHFVFFPSVFWLSPPPVPGLVRFQFRPTPTTFCSLLANPSEPTNATTNPGAEGGVWINTGWIAQLALRKSRSGSRLRTAPEQNKMGDLLTKRCFECDASWTNLETTSQFVYLLNSRLNHRDKKK